MTEETSDRAAVRVADATAAIGTRLERITLDNGIVISIKSVPPQVMRQATRHLPEPPVPVVHLQDADRDEENPNDPRYRIALMQWENDKAQAQLTVALLLGTAVESVPEGFQRPEDTEWVDDIMAAAAIMESTPPTIPADGKGRYLAWLRLYAITSELDTFVLTRALVTGFALTEEEVQNAAASFRRDIADATNPTQSAALAPLLGDIDTLDDRGDGERVRGEGDSTVEQPNVGAVAGPPAG